MSEDFWSDLRLAGRALVNGGTATLVAALVLGVGIGANAAVFSVVEAVLLGVAIGVGAIRVNPMTALRYE